MAKRKEYFSNSSRLQVFTDRFREEVDRIGSSQKAADLTGFSRPTIDFWYSGARIPDSANLITLSSALGVSADYLLGLSDVRSSKTNVKSVCKYTGLSQESVDFLTHFSKGFVIDYVNDFLPLSGEFFIIMNAVKLNCDKAKKILNDPSVTVEECVDLWRDMKFSKYTLMESAWKVLNTCYNLDELTEQVSTHGKEVKEGSV